jgi:hypothetical protein
MARIGRRAFVRLGKLGRNELRPYKGLAVLRIEGGLGEPRTCRGNR